MTQQDYEMELRTAIREELLNHGGCFSDLVGQEYIEHDMVDDLVAVILAVNNHAAASSEL